MILLKRQPLSSFGLTPIDINQWLTAARALRSATTPVGRVEVLTGSKEAAQPRRVTLVALAYLTNVNDRLPLQHRVERSLLDQRVPLETADRPGVQTWVYCESIEWKEAPSVPKLMPPISCVMTFLALNGGSEDVEPWAPVLLSTTPAAMPVGTLPSDGLITLWGGTSPVVVTYSPADGQNSLTLTVTQAMSAGDAVTLDMATTEAWYQTSAGVRTRISGNVTGTWFTVDPNDVRGAGVLDGTSSVVSPTISVSSGSGLWIGRRRWRT